MRSILQAQADIAERQAELARMGLARQPTAMHRQAFTVLRDLLTMGKDLSNGSTPAPMRALLRTLDKMEPVFLDEMAKVEAEPFRAFIADLVRRLQTIVDAPVD